VESLSVASGPGLETHSGTAFCGKYFAATSFSCDIHESVLTFGCSVIEFCSVAYQRGDYIAIGVREILLYGFVLGAIFFGFGWFARPALDQRVAVMADDEISRDRHVEGEYQWMFYRDADGKLRQALAKPYLGPGSPFGYPKIQ
jgi:hypothetical protein